MEDRRKGLGARGGDESMWERQEGVQSRSSPSPSSSSSSSSPSPSPSPSPPSPASMFNPSCDLSRFDLSKHNVWGLRLLSRPCPLPRNSLPRIRVGARYRHRAHAAGRRGGCGPANIMPTTTGAHRRAMIRGTLRRVSERVR
ncbi:unnamed protein product [Closterium sp. Yama58-4]|nr:unnamed protein product [Closterium sp. Yama58-4]